MTKYVSIILILLIACNNRVQPHNYSPPSIGDINDIIQAVLYSDSLLLSTRITKLDTLIKEKKSIKYYTHTPLSVELRKLIVTIPDSKSDLSSSRKTVILLPPSELNTVSTIFLLDRQINGAVFFDKKDSLYLLYQNDTLKHFVMDEKLLSKFNLTTFAEQKGKYKVGTPMRFYDLTIPIISLDHKKAYVELTLNGSGATALYLEKINGEWTILYKRELWIS